MGLAAAAVLPAVAGGMAGSKATSETWAAEAAQLLDYLFRRLLCYH